MSMTSPCRASSWHTIEKWIPSILMNWNTTLKVTVKGLTRALLCVSVFFSLWEQNVITSLYVYVCVCVWEQQDDGRVWGGWGQVSGWTDAAWSPDWERRPGASQPAGWGKNPAAPFMLQGSHGTSYYWLKHSETASAYITCVFGVLRRAKFNTASFFCVIQLFCMINID